MAFSESMNLGNSTFMNLELEVKRAINNKSVEGNTQTLIGHSQKRKINETWSKRNAFRRNKSDDTLLQRSLLCSTKAGSSHNYSKYFNSDFHISCAEIDGEINSESILVSELENALIECNEDAHLKMSNCINRSRKTKIKSSRRLSLDDDSISHLSIQKSISTTAPNIAIEDCKTNDNLHEIDMLDASSFLGNKDHRDKYSISKELQASQRHLLESINNVPLLSENCRNRSNLASYLSNSRISENISKRQVLQLRPDDFENLKNISAWNLPTAILHEYERKGVIKMFDWQVKCLSNPKVLHDHCNLVYSAPTSAGKTLVSEILLLKTVLERSKKVLLILPFISVVREKMVYLQDLLTPAGYRVEGFFGGYTPPGGFDSVNVAICTIEKANSIVNKLLEQGKLDVLGMIVVDEVHLISDPGRGYILELLLAKTLYMSRKYALQIQIVTMSATLANVELLKCWLDAELYITDFRPVALHEMIKVGNNIYDSNMRLIRDVSKSEIGIEYDSLLKNDSDHVARLCIETLLEGCSVIVFCASKDWCETLAVQLAGAIHAVGKNGGELGKRLRTQIKRPAIDDVKKQLRDIPTGLEATLEKTVTYACAFHHAGLTTEERDIIEMSFKSGALKIIVATSTLSSGVNLPARRVIIRSPLFGGKQMNPLTYRQMIGRAGRTGKDTVGESILICTEGNARIGQELISVDLKPISSCLHMDDSAHLKRALLEVIASGVAVTKTDIECFVHCTLLGTQKQLHVVEKDKSINEDNSAFINDALNFLIEYEFVRLQVDEETTEENYYATRLGMACLASSIPPADGLILFSELQKSRRCFVLESELHAVYLVTPYSVCYQLQDLDWLLYLDLWEQLSTAMKKVGEMVGVKESFLVRAMRGQTKLDYKLMQIHKRFYIALALQELVNEIPINEVATKYKCTRGMLQGLQQMASTFAGIVTSFCNSLQWSTLSLIVSQFKDRLFFGIHRDLIDLMRLPDLNHKRARALFDSGITTLVELAHTDVCTIEKVLQNALSFDSSKQYENENALEAKKRNLERNIFITGKRGITVAEASKQLLHCARRFVQLEIGVDKINWTGRGNDLEHEMHMLRDGQSQMFRKGKNSLESENVIRRELIRSNSNSNLMPRKIQKDKGKEDLNAKNLECQYKDILRDERLLQYRNKNSDVTITHGHQIPIKAALSVNSPLRNFSLEIVTEDSKKKREDKLTTRTRSKLKSFLQQDTILHSELNSAKSNKENSIAISSDKKLSTSGEAQEYKKIACKIENSTKDKIQSQSYNTRYALRNSQESVNRFKIPLKRKDSSSTLKILKSQKESIVPRRSIRINKNRSLESLEKADSKHFGNTLVSQNVTKDTKLEDDLFMEDESFEINTGIEDALAGVGPSKNLDTPIAVNIKSMNTSGEEVAYSQEFLKTEDPIATERPSTPLSTRRLSSRLRRLESPLTIKSAESTKDMQMTSFEQQRSSTVEISDLSAEDSLIQNPNKLNASHIMSCSEAENKSSPLDCVKIVNICGNKQLFEEAFKELMSLKRFSISLGLQKHNAKRRPVIGANLLINQIAAKEGDILENAKIVDFQVDSSTYLAGIAFGVTENIVYYLNMQQQGSPIEPTSDEKCSHLRKLLASKDITLMSFDIKEQLKVLMKIIPDLYCINVELEDPKIGNWLLQPDKILSLQRMVQQYAPECSALIGLCGSGRGYNSYGLDADNAIPSKIRCAVEACVTSYVLSGQIENLEGIGTGQLYKFFKELEMPLQYSLCRMELFGYPASEKKLRKVFQQMVDTIKKLENRIYQLHGTRFNLSSSAAVAKVLGLHRKVNGRTCTSRQILEKIDSPISQLIILYRKLNVTLSKNVQPLLKAIRNNRLHGQSITVTSTGRISMIEPNLQNVAKDFYIDLQTGSEQIRISCRSAFFPEDAKRSLISSDFCQLEMRILAHLSQDASLMAVMHTDKDVFTAMAARWNNIPEETVSEQLRNGTKQICYGIVYGMGIRSLAEALKCTEQEAKVISDQFHAAYPGIRSYADKVIKFARSNGYIETITGRRRYLEHINSCEAQLKNQAERQAVNSAIQGSAADIAKSAILRMERNILKYRDKLSIDVDSVRFVLHLHDELIFEVPEEKARKVAKVLKITMENCVKLNVPLKVKLKIGHSWSDLEEINV